MFVYEMSPSVLTLAYNEGSRQVLSVGVASRVRQE